MRHTHMQGFSFCPRYDSVVLWLFCKCCAILQVFVFVSNGGVGCRLLLFVQRRHIEACVLSVCSVCHLQSELLL